MKTLRGEPAPGSRVHPARFRLLAALAALACGGGATPTSVTTVVVSPAVELLVGVGAQARFTARVEGSGQTAVTWSVADPSVASVDRTGLVTALAPGETRVVAEAGGSTASATVEVYLPPEVEAYLPGTAYLGRRDYVEYLPGTLPVVVSAPHGGPREPAEIGARQGGTQVTDLNTIPVARAVREAFVELFGAAPHVVIMHLDRSRLDANREIVEAAEGNPFAERAWEEYHGFVETASEAVEARWGSGLYLDIHGHGHDIPRVELGYLLPAATLNLSEEALNAAGPAPESSIAALHARQGGDFAALLRGSESLGGLLEAEGTACVPSPASPGPGDDPYFTGGYSTRRHGSRNGGTVDGVQLELHRPGLRDTPENRAAFAAALARAVRAFLSAHYGLEP